MKSKLLLFIILVIFISSSGCITAELEEPTNIPTGNSVLPTRQAILIETEKAITPTGNIEISQATNTMVPQAFNWKNWPILPVVSHNAKEIYRRGLTQGNDPTHFSILGDCQSEPAIFMGRFETDPEVLAGLPQNLSETVNYFKGSFSRLGPTIKPGTTAGAILWPEWIDQSLIKYCNENETPLDCELRVWKPSIVLINLGTHWEARNNQYFDQIMDTLIARGILPILATKADNREGDNSINLQIAETAEKYDVPIWNFWKAVHEMPDGGLKNASDVADLYLTDAGLDVHRYSALKAIDGVWRQVNAP